MVNWQLLIMLSIQQRNTVVLTDSFEEIVDEPNTTRITTDPQTTVTWILLHYWKRHFRSPEDWPMAFMTGPSGLPTEGLLFIGWFIGLLCGGPQFMIPPPELQTMGLLWGPSGLPMPGPQFIGPQFIGPIGLPIGAPQFIGLPPIWHAPGGRCIMWGLHGICLGPRWFMEITCCCGGMSSNGLEAIIVSP